MFTSGCRESSSFDAKSPIKIENFTPTTIQSTMEFIYTNNISTYNPTDLESHFDLLRAADYFQVSNLHEYRMNRITTKYLNERTALKIFAVANQYKGDHKLLATRVKDWVRSRWDYLVMQAEFRQSMKEVESGLIPEIFYW
ncbi:hypothetical protein HDV00_006641 [Rhizophlyctis rosea]|nr:hypothetical protein HDV00_006641 [Rhizophlyctis rosea]